MLSDESAPQRTGTSGEPMANRRGYFQRLAKSKRHQSVERLAVVGIVGKGERALLPCQGRRSLEQLGIMLLHVAKVADKCRRKSLAIRIAEETGETSERVGVGRQGMSLLVVHHLQPVLDRAEKIISGREIFARIAADPSAVGQLRQRRERAAVAQFRMPSSGD